MLTGPLVRLSHTAGEVEERRSEWPKVTPWIHWHRNQNSRPAPCSQPLVSPLSPWLGFCESKGGKVSFYTQRIDMHLFWKRSINYIGLCKIGRDSQPLSPYFGLLTYPLSQSSPRRGNTKMAFKYKHWLGHIRSGERSLGFKMSGRFPSVMFSCLREGKDNQPRTYLFRKGPGITRPAWAFWSWYHTAAGLMVDTSQEERHFRKPSLGKPGIWGEKRMNEWTTATGNIDKSSYTPYVDRKKPDTNSYVSMYMKIKNRQN